MLSLNLTKFCLVTKCFDNHNNTKNYPQSLDKAYVTSCLNPCGQNVENFLFSWAYKCSYLFILYYCTIETKMQ